MAVLQMQKLCICALKKDRKAILELLQAAGVMEIAQEADDDSGFSRTDTMASRQEFDRNASVAEQALEILAEYAPEKTSLFASLEGKTLTEKAQLDALEDSADVTLEDARKLLALSKQAAEQKAGVSKLEARIEGLTPWMQLDIPMKCQTTEKTQILVGAVGGQTTLEALYAAVAERAPEIEGVDIEIVGADRDQTCVVAVCLKKDAEHLEEALRAAGFARPSQALDVTPAAYAEELKEEIEKLRKETEKTENAIRAYEGSRGNLRLLSDYYRIRAQKYEVLGQLLQSEKTFLVTGYVPKREVEKLEKKLSARFELAFEAEDIPEDEEAPVLLSNNKFASIAEGITTSFGLPAKGEMDPTAIMAACYVFLFGLMLSDAAYGLIVFLVCFIMLKKFPRMGENMQKSIRLFMYCGLSTLFWGVLFGGWFGDAVDIIGKVFLGKEISIPALWFVPLNNPMKLLLFSLIFGVIHLFLGLALKGYMLLRDGKVLDFVCDVVFWYLLLIGLILMLVPTELFAPIAQAEIVFPPAVNTLAKWMAIVGAVGIFLMSARSNKNPVLRLALGAYDLYNLTGWLSDVLSYSRLLALGLATGVIASVVNQMGSMVGNNIFGIIVFIAVFIFGHIFNLAINLLGAYVHTCRLQYVEFFGKFYEGGGREFVPFKQNTKYVEIKED